MTLLSPNVTTKSMRGKVLGLGAMIALALLAGFMLAFGLLPGLDEHEHARRLLV